ncbi:MAG: helix-turn-helix domain-containing protein [Clostridiales Family XIII bacterium]|jgi:transcriptional regulator with XRE-family HTH domain|nr:helix-turn-helix domain-containing protein [Clostridiales Family XIII bacterium]
MKNELSQEIGKRIQKFRQAQNLTQEYVAEQLDITTKYYASTERGEKQLSLEKLLSLLRILDVTANDLFPINEETAVIDRESYNNKIKDILNEFETADQYVTAIIILKAIREMNR